MRRGRLVRAITTTASPIRTAKWPLPLVSRDSSSSTGVATFTIFDFVKRAGRKRKQWPADAVAFWNPSPDADSPATPMVFARWNVVGIVQVDQLCSGPPTDAFAVPGATSSRIAKARPSDWDADPLPIIGVVIDVALRRWHQLWRRRSCAGRRFSLVFCLVRDLTGSSLHGR